MEIRGVVTFGEEPKKRVVESRGEGVPVGEVIEGVEEFLYDPGGGGAPSSEWDTIRSGGGVVGTSDRVGERSKVGVEVGTREGDRVGK